MLNTAAWPELELSVLTGIHLDPKNVRLETANAQIEADILEDLFANENALGLVEAISKVGYLTHERPIVVKRRGEYVVVEGNRRVAALKAIQNPMIVPDFQARVSGFAKNIPDVGSLANIRVMVAPNQSVADQLIAAIHTGNLRKPWSPARQAAFFRAQMAAGRKYAELVRRYPTIDVRYFIFRAHIVNLFQNMNYDDPELRDFLTTNEWRRGLSTLSRIYESKDFLNLTGLVMDDKGVLGKAISDEAMKEIATIIVQGIKIGELNTRSLNTVRSPAFTRLMAELKEAADTASRSPGPGPTPPVPTGPGGGQPTGPGGGQPTGPGGGQPTGPGGGQPTGPGGGQPTNKSGGSGQPAPKPAAPKKSKPNFLSVGLLVPPAQYPIAVRLHLEELSALNIQKFPNATFLMLRALLEKSIKAYAEAKGIVINGSRNNGYVQLYHALKWYGEYVTQNGPRALIQPVTQLQSGKLVNYTASSDALNAINHNHHFSVDPDEVVNCWNSIDSILRELMKP